MPEETDTPLHSYRCECGKLLFRGLIHDGTVQIKCKRCGRLASFQGTDDTVKTEAQYALMFNRRGEIISASSNIRDAFGYSISELLSKQHHELLPTGSCDLITNHFERLWSVTHKEQYVFRTKVTYRHRDGRAVPGYMVSKFVPTPNHSVVLFSTFYTNIDHSPVLASEFSFLREYPFFMVVSPEGICLEASGARQRPYVRPRGEIVGRLLTDFMHEDDETKQELLRQLGEHRPFEVIGKHYSRVNGGSVRMDVYFVPNFNANGDCTDYSLYVYDHDILAVHERQFALKLDA